MNTFFSLFPDLLCFIVFRFADRGTIACRLSIDLSSIVVRRECAANEKRFNKTKWKQMQIDARSAACSAPPVTLDRVEKQRHNVTTEEFNSVLATWIARTNAQNKKRKKTNKRWICCVARNEARPTRRTTTCERCECATKRDAVRADDATRRPAGKRTQNPMSIQSSAYRRNVNSNYIERLSVWRKERVKFSGDFMHSLCRSREITFQSIQCDSSETNEFAILTRKNFNVLWTKRNEKTLKELWNCARIVRCECHLCGHTQNQFRKRVLHTHFPCVAGVFRKRFNLFLSQVMRINADTVCRMWASKDSKHRNCE